MARGWHYAKLSLSNAPRLSFSGLCILLFLFLSLCRFLCVLVFLLLSLELGRCSSDLLLSSRPRTGLATTYIVVVFFTLTDRASTIPSNTRGCQSGTWSAGQKKIRGTSTKLQREQRKTQTHKRQRDRNRNNKIHRSEKDKRLLDMVEARSVSVKKTMRFPRRFSEDVFHT